MLKRLNRILVLEVKNLPKRDYEMVSLRDSNGWIDSGSAEVLIYPFRLSDGPCWIAMDLPAFTRKYTDLAISWPTTDWANVGEFDPIRGTQTGVKFDPSIELQARDGINLRFERPPVPTRDFRIIAIDTLGNRYSGQNRMSGEWLDHNYKISEITWNPGPDGPTSATLASAPPGIDKVEVQARPIDSSSENWKTVQSFLYDDRGPVSKNDSSMYYFRHGCLYALFSDDMGIADRESRLAISRRGSSTIYSLIQTPTYELDLEPDGQHAPSKGEIVLKRLILQTRTDSEMVIPNVLKNLTGK